MKERCKKMLNRIKGFSFYKKKKFYVILTVLFSLILLADVAVAVFVPKQSGRFGIAKEFSQMGGFSDSTGESSGSGEMPSMPEGMEIPSDGEMPSMPEGMEMPSDGEMPSMPDGIEMPSDGEMPEGMERPNRGQMSGDGAESQDSAVGSGDRSEMENMFQQNQSFLQKIRSHWLVIFIIFFLLDAASITMLVLISKKEKKQKLLEEKELEEKRIAEGGAPVRVRKPAKKESHSKYVGLIVAGAMVLLVIVVNILTSQTGKEVEQTEATVHSGVVETGSVSSILPGTGTLTDEESVDLELPANVEITKWYVSNGDTVAEGDKLAQVDTVSVMSAIVAVQEKLAALDEELEDHEDEEISDTIVAGAAGKVKVIYAEEDTGVIETMYANGSLMLISLDGLMAVSMETDAEISAGDAVTVTLSDDTEISGKVESVIDGTAVVTVSDEETEYDESVTVTTKDGTKVGTGKLYIHSELKVTGFTGLVSDVEVSVDEDVSSGEALLTLTDTDYTGEYELLLAKRSELETQMQTLFQLYQEQYVYASCAGVISGLDTTTVTADAGDADTSDSASSEVEASVDATGANDAEIEASATNAVSATNTATTNVSDNISVSQTSYKKAATITKTSGGMMTASYTKSSVGSNGGVKMVSDTSGAGISTLDKADAAAATVIEPEVVSEPAVVSESTDGNNTSNNESGSGNGDGTTSGGGTTPDNGDGTTSGDGTTTGSGDGTTSGNGNGTTSGDGTTSGNGNGTTSGDGTTPDNGNGTTSGDGTTTGGTQGGGTTPGENPTIPDADNSDSYYIGVVTNVTNENGTVQVDLTSASGAGMKKVSLSASLHVYTFANGKYAGGTASDIQSGDMLMLIYGTDTTSTTPAFCIRISGSSSDGTQLPGSSDMAGDTGTNGNSGSDFGSQMGGSGSSQMPSGSSSATDMSNATAYTEVMAILEEEVENDYSVATTTWLAVTPQEKMEVTITVDEMDILSLEAGQEAMVTLDAFPGQSFDGMVTKVHVSGTNSGGSSKYQAVVSIDRQENMLAGMNASVQITLDTKDGVLTVPAAALIEEESGVYVYTSYDEKTETFGDMVEVVTGVSDGENVEILSGLEEGSEYWYNYLDVVNYSTSSVSRGGFSLDSMFGGGRGR